MRRALDPSTPTLVGLGIGWLLLLLVLSVIGLGVLTFPVAILWAVLLIYLVAIVVYAFAREEESPITRWAQRALNAPQPVVIGLAVIWVVLSLVLVIFGLGVLRVFTLGGLAFPLGFAWAVLLLYLIAAAIQDHLRRQDESA